MKIAVFSLLCLVCAQGLYGASISDRSEPNKSSTDISVYSTGSNDLTVYSDSDVEVFGNRINIFSCFNAARQSIGLAFSAWSNYSKHSSIVNKAAAAKKECAKLTVPEEVQKCNKNAQDTEDQELAQWKEDVWKLWPTVLSTAMEMVKCVL